MQQVSKITKTRDRGAYYHINALARATLMANHPSSDRKIPQKTPTSRPITESHIFWLMSLAVKRSPKRLQ